MREEHEREAPYGDPRINTLPIPQVVTDATIAVTLAPFARNSQVFTLRSQASAQSLDQMNLNVAGAGIPSGRVHVQIRRTGEERHIELSIAELFLLQGQLRIFMEELVGLKM